MTKILILLLFFCFCAASFAQVSDPANKIADTSTVSSKPLTNNQFKNALGVKIAPNYNIFGATYRHYFKHIVFETNIWAGNYWAGFQTRNEFLVLFQFNSKSRFQPYIGGGIITRFWDLSDEYERISEKINYYQKPEKGQVYFYPLAMALAGVELLPKKWRIAYFADVSLTVDFFDLKVATYYLSGSVGIRYRFTKNKK